MGDWMQPWVDLYQRERARVHLEVTRQIEEAMFGRKDKNGHRRDRAQGDGAQAGAGAGLPAGWASGPSGITVPPPRYSAFHHAITGPGSGLTSFGGFSALGFGPRPPAGQIRDFSGGSAGVPEPIRTKKIALVVRSEKGGWVFRGTGGYGEYGVDDDMRCPKDRGHVQPVEECTCGFYAYLPGQGSIGYDPYSGMVAELDVEMSGFMLVGKKGVRAEHQRVLSARLWSWESVWCSVEVPVRSRHSHGGDSGDMWALTSTSPAVTVTRAQLVGQGNLTVTHEPRHGRILPDVPATTVCGNDATFVRVNDPTRYACAWHATYDRHRYQEHDPTLRTDQIRADLPTEWTFPS